MARFWSNQLHSVRIKAKLAQIEPSWRKSKKKKKKLRRGTNVRATASGCIGLGCGTLLAAFVLSKARLRNGGGFWRCYGYYSTSVREVWHAQSSRCCLLWCRHWWEMRRTPHSIGSSWINASLCSLKMRLLSRISTPTLTGPNLKLCKGPLKFWFLSNPCLLMLFAMLKIRQAFFLSFFCLLCCCYQPFLGNGIYRLIIQPLLWNFYALQLGVFSYKGYFFSFPFFFFL